MKKRVTNLMLLLFSIITILVFNTKVAFCQNDEPGSVDAERYFSAFGEIVRKTPEYYSLQRGFDKNEMHLLDTLSNEERAFIESEVDPPAIGVVRDLKPPIVFNLRNVEIPLNGEISTKDDFAFNQFELIGELDEYGSIPDQSLRIMLFY